MRLLILFFSLVAISNPSWARECDATSFDARQIGLDEYDANDLTDSIVRVSVRLSDDCELDDLRITPRDASVFVLASAGSALNSTHVDAPEVFASNRSEILFSPLGLKALLDGVEVPFEFLKLDAGQFVPSGNYQTILDFTSNGQELGTLVVNVLVSPTIRMFGEAENGNINVDLGRLNEGVSIRRSIYFRSNARTTLTIESDNLGALTHENGAQLGTIPYSSSLNGIPLNLKGPTGIDMAPNSGQLTEAAVQIDVAPVTSAYAGVYRDVITLSFTAQ
ncbi:hypothetical protein [Qipengyuania sp. JC766]|uniref:hypothetical protein n=1 Tax=Qipengyuania sp. JC766 TaxID=3232139 RepID=UPI003458F80B